MDTVGLNLTVVRVQADGDDIRVTGSDGVTELPIELVSIDTVAKTGELPKGGIKKKTMMDWKNGTNI